jgi:hypothetical protein
MKPPSEADRILDAARARQRRREAAGAEVPVPKAKRKHAKRHSVNRERSRDDAQKAAAGSRKAAETAARRRALSEAFRAYFAGEAPDLSTAIKRER